MEKKKPKKRKGIVVKTIDKKELVPASEAEVIIPYKGEFAIDLIEKELADLEKDLLKVNTELSVLDKLLGVDPRKQELGALKANLEKIETIRKIRDEFSKVATQMYKRHGDLLDAKASALQKEIMTTKEVQELIANREIRKLRIENLEAEVKELGLRKDIERLKKETKEQAEEKEFSYDLKDIDHLAGEDEEEYEE